MKRVTSIGVLVAVAGSAHGQFTGPSTSTSPYLLPTRAGVTTTSIFTAGDIIGGYRMVGIPDGLGAWRNAGQANFNVVMNHEIPAGSGAVRAHGQNGAFVSRWEIAPNLAVVSGRDHNTSSSDAWEYSTTTGTWSNAPSSAQRWSRFCSGDLAAPSAYYNPNTGLGTQNRVYLNGEEVGAEGRAYAHIVTGAATNQTWHLPHLGRFSWENSMASPFAQDKTVVIGTDDSTPGQVYMYVGNKQAAGNDIERAGLTNGGLYGVRVTGLVGAGGFESRATPAAGRFDLHNFGDVSNTTGANLNSSSNSNNVTNFLRPEDGAWDPRPGHENDFYFVTTDRFNNPPGTPGNSRLYRMRFDDITNPTAGGEVTMLVDGFVSGPQMMDNMCIDSLGRILLQEDPGGQDYLSKVWLYDINTGGLGVVAQHDAFRFLPSSTGFLTRDEESSGIIDAADLLGPGWFLLDTQAHYSIPGELYEGGQLMAMYVDPNIIPAPGALAMLGLGGVFAARRRR